MAQILAIAYNTGSDIPGTLQYGVLAVSDSNRDYSNNYGGVQWWASPDLDQRYVIGYPDPTGSHPTPIEGVTAYLGFWGTDEKTDQEFINLCNRLIATNKINPIGITSFGTALEAHTWLIDNGYWSSYPSGARLAPKSLSLCYIYYPCDEGEDYILIREENADQFPIGKWFDGNCYYNSNVTTNSTNYTFISGKSYYNCENCTSNCDLDMTLSTVDCYSLNAELNEVQITPTPTPTPTSTEPPCFNPSVEEVNCNLDSDVTEANPTPTPTPTSTSDNSVEVTPTPTPTSTSDNSVEVTPTPTPTSSEGLNNVFNVSSDLVNYVINGQINPTLKLNRGVNYTFNIAASGNPFYIKTRQITGKTDTYDVGVTNNGTDNGIIRFAVPLNAPNRLYYICEFHSTMGGIIDII